MTLHIRRCSEGRAEIWAEDRLLVRSLTVDLTHFVSQQSARDALDTSPWQSMDGPAVGTLQQTLRQVVSMNGSPLLEAELFADSECVTFAVTLQQPLSNLHVGDTFDAFSLAFPRMSLPESYRCFATTYGLGPSGEAGVGGYWPEAILTDSTEQLPAKALSPLVLFNARDALAIAPSSQLLTSSLLYDQGDIVRALHGSVPSLEAGTRIETTFAWGENLTDALLSLGKVLLERGGKQRPEPRDHVMTSALGWWNAYGGYYTEPIHPLNAASLTELLHALKVQGIPIGYLGLDLWYPYKYIGQALRFAPDPDKYPDGVGSIANAFDLPTVLHLSALSPENDYKADGSDPSFYKDVAIELREQGAVVAWHDWLRTQQHLTARLRENPAAADAWFTGMALAMEEQNISVMTCMHTMGMVLASTALPHVIAARSSIDYLFAQPEALDTLEHLGEPGFKDEQTSLTVIRRQNLLVGFTYYALGLLPFYDLFLTRWQDGVGGLAPQEEAILRALSCGPVGLGDGPGMTDTELVARLVSSSGDLLQPDHPPYPDSETLGQAVEIYRTQRETSQATWDYVLVLNTSFEEQPFDVTALCKESMIWDGVNQRVVERMEGSLQSGELAYFVLAPLVDGISPLGLWNKTVPAPSHVLLDATWDNGWHLNVYADGETIAIWTSDPVSIKDGNGHELAQERNGSFVLCALGEGVTSVHITRR